ncbi:NAD(P)-binding protein [Xylariaceae sp. FL1272]|nr:NAD(P)-binding protein [Xylariaceae sp. FL1272]
MDRKFDIAPEKRASKLHFLYRQLFITPPLISTSEHVSGATTAIVTGASGGLGLEIARQLLDLGYKLILAVRDESKGQVAREQLARGRQLQSDSISVWELDLISFESCVQFAKRARELETLDVAVLNAGVFKVNYLSTVLLALLLRPVIKMKRVGSDPGRIVLITSDTAAWAAFDERHARPILEAFTVKASPWSMSERYGTSKLLGQLFLSELAHRVSSSEVILSCANPGLCRRSGLGRQAGPFLWVMYTISTYLLGRRCTVGARSCVHAAVNHGEDSHGQYIEDGKIQPMPPFVYSAEGRGVAKVLFEETITELSSAGSREALHEVAQVDNAGA